MAFTRDLRRRRGAVTTRRRQEAHRHRPGRLGGRAQGDRQARRSPPPSRTITLKAPAAGRHRHRRDRRRRRRRPAQPRRLRRPDRQRQVADPRLRRPRPVQGHPDHRRGRAGRNGPALQGGRGRLGRAAPRAPRAASTTGTPPAAETPSAVLRDYAVVHYQRPDGDYDGLGPVRLGRHRRRRGHDLAGRPPLHRPGRLRRLRLGQARSPAPSNVGFLVIDKDGNKDVAADRIDRRHQDRRDLARAGQGRPSAHEQPDGRLPAAGHRPRPSCTTSAPTATTPAGACTSGPAPRTPPTGRSPLQPVGPTPTARSSRCRSPTAPPASATSSTRATRRTCPPTSRSTSRANGHEVWLLDRPGEVPAPAAGGPRADARPDHVQGAGSTGTPSPGTAPTDGRRPRSCCTRRDGAIAVEDGALTGDDDQLAAPAQRPRLTDAQKARFPHLKDYTAFTVDPRDRDRVREALRGQVVATQRAANGAAARRDRRADRRRARRPVRRPPPTGRPRAGRSTSGRPTLSVWAPTAQRVVRCELDGTDRRRCGATTRTGVWSVTGPSVLDGQALPVRRHGLGAQRPEGRHQQGHRPLLGRPDRRLRAQPGRRPGRHGPRPERLVVAAASRTAVPLQRRADPGAARPGLLRRRHHRAGQAPRHLPRLHRHGRRRHRSTCGSWPTAGHVVRPPAARLRHRHHPRAAGRPGDRRLRPRRPTPADSDQQQECVGEDRREGRLQLGLRPAATTPSPRARTPPTRTAPAARSSSGRWCKALNERRPAGRHGRRLQPHRGQRPGRHQSVLDQIVPGYYQRLLADGIRRHLAPAAPTPRPRTP